jgi:hypothetical protein
MSEVAIFVNGPLTVRGNRRMVIQRIVPAGATIAEPKKKAADCEEKAKQTGEPEASRRWVLRMHTDRDNTLCVPVPVLESLDVKRH